QRPAQPPVVALRRDLAGARDRHPARGSGRRSVDRDELRAGRAGAGGPRGAWARPRARHRNDAGHRNALLRAAARGLDTACAVGRIGDDGLRGPDMAKKVAPKKVARLDLDFSPARRNRPVGWPLLATGVAAALLAAVQVQSADARRMALATELNSAHGRLAGTKGESVRAGPPLD